jgi:hypothetical protein
MPIHHAVPWLMFMTLGVVAVIAVVLLVWHLRKPSNRHPMDDQPDKNIAQEIDSGRRGGA